jgi:NADP-reducing hydrogenase subunit HndB
MKTLDELNAIKNQYKSSVAIRTDDYRIRIVVGMGNTGLVAGARDVLKAFVQMIDENGLSGDIIVTQEARVSKVGYNPVVKIVENGVTTAVYSKVTTQMVQRIVDEHIKGGKIIDEYILVDDSVEEV